MISLALEASTYAGSAALFSEGRVVAEVSVAMRGRDSEALMPAVAEILRRGSVGPEVVERVICGDGPGAFTSLRIAGAIAKGICLGTGAELLPVSSLALIVGSRGVQSAERTLAVSDAMRGESYCQLFETDEEGIITPAGPPSLRSTAACEEIARLHGARMIGPHCVGDDCVIPRAAAIVNLSAILAITAPADLAAWEPVYGRLAEAQVKWEAAHGRPLAAR